MSYNLSGSSGSGRTPLRENVNTTLSSMFGTTKAGTSSASYASTSTYSSMPSAASAQTSFELLQAKIEHLERERVDLSLQLHQQSEKERTKKFHIEKLETSLKSSEREKEALCNSLEDAHATAKTFKEEKEQLVAEKEQLILECKKLNEQIEAKNAEEAENKHNLWTKMTASSREQKRLDEEVAKLRREKVDLSHEKDQLTNTVIMLREANEKQKEEMNLLIFDADRNHRTEKETKKGMETEISALQTFIEETTKNHEQEKEAFGRERDAMIEEMDKLRKQVAAGGRPKRGDNGEDMDEDDDIAALGLTEALTLIENLKKKLLQCELKRKQLHNTLQELRGNIRVFVRCRPFLRGDGEEYDNNDGTINDNPDLGGCVRFHKDGSSVSLVGATARSNQIFSFDQVFKCNSTQEEVYHEVSDLVQSALDGYKVCIFSYGQTGSGKTHTMSGGREGSAGIIPRSVEQIVAHVLRMRSDGWEITVHASMLEIYNEELRDLLCQDNHNGTSKSSSSSSAATATKDKLKVSNLQGFVTVAGLTSVELDTRDLRSGTRHLEQLLDKANKSRMTACTAMNERSSRSHALFMLDIAAKHSDGTTYLRGGLRLCDLAGSERLDRTGTASDAARLKETVNINKSLSCLADVFVALANKAPHVPYRNSKLTMVLQDCLSGDGKALMFVNVSPTAASSQETLCSLRFANQVSQVELGKATKSVFNIMPPAMQPPQTMLNGSSSSSSSHSTMTTMTTSASSVNDHHLSGTANSNTTTATRSGKVTTTRAVNATTTSTRATRQLPTQSIPATSTAVNTVNSSSSSHHQMAITASGGMSLLDIEEECTDDKGLPTSEMTTSMSTGLVSMSTNAVTAPNRVPFAIENASFQMGMTTAVSSSAAQSTLRSTSQRAKRSAAVLNAPPSNTFQGLPPGAGGNVITNTTSFIAPPPTDAFSVGPVSKRSRQQNTVVATTTTTTMAAVTATASGIATSTGTGGGGGGSRSTWR